MATTDKTIITAAGRSMLVDLDNNKAHANGFNIYFSTGDLTGMTDDQLVNLQDIQSKDIKVPATVIHLDQGDTRIRAEATYNGPQKGIYINTYATYAVDANGNELLFAIYLNSEPQYLLASTTAQDTTQGYGFNIGISQTNNVDFTKLADNVATLQDVKTMIDGGDAVTIHGDQTIIGNKNFTGNIQVNGQNVATKTNVGDAYNQAVKDAENYSVKDNHDGTVVNAGQIFAMNAPLAPCNLNEITTDGIFHSTDVIGKYGDIIADIFNTRTLSKFTLFTFHNDLDIYQTIYIPGMQPYYRTRYGYQWHEWEKLGGADDSAIYRGALGNFNARDTNIQAGTYNINYQAQISGLDNLNATAWNGGKMVKRNFDESGQNGTIIIYLPDQVIQLSWKDLAHPNGSTWRVHQL